MQKIKVPFQKLKYIHHISDIQIRNLKRHTEYEEVFEQDDYESYFEYTIQLDEDEVLSPILTVTLDEYNSLLNLSFFGLFILSEIL